jgi:release factor glutamine methyltransferase
MPDDGGQAFEYAGIRYLVHEDVYEPHDDTWALVDQVQGLSLEGKRVLEVGCGTGLALLAAVARGARGVGVDRNPAAVRLLRENARLNDVAQRVDAVRGDLVSAFVLQGFDLVMFNPPYLPSEPDQPVSEPLSYALEGGPTGDEVIDRFLVMLEGQAAEGARIPEVMMVLSNHNDEQMVRRRMSALGRPVVEPGEMKRYFFHRIWVEHYRG